MWRRRSRSRESHARPQFPAPRDLRRPVCRTAGSGPPPSVGIRSQSLLYCHPLRTAARAQWPPTEWLTSKGLLLAVRGTLVQLTRLCSDSIRRATSLMNSFPPHSKTSIEKGLVLTTRIVVRMLAYCLSLSRNTHRIGHALGILGRFQPRCASLKALFIRL